MSTFVSKLTWLTESTLLNVKAAFALKILGRGWILSGNSSKLANFLLTAPWLKAVNLHQLRAHVFASGCGSENLWNQAKHTALFAELSCAMQTEELLFSRDKPILKLTNKNFEPSLQIPPCLQFNDASLSCNHMLDSNVAPKIIYWTAYGCIRFCNLMAYNYTHVSLTS